MTDWFARAVLHVTDVEASLRFYVDRLGFTTAWRHDENGRTRVAQVDRQGWAVILADTWPEKAGKGVIFISLNTERQAREAVIAALHALRAELEGKGVLVKDGSWGYRLLVVDDPRRQPALLQLSSVVVWRSLASLVLHPNPDQHPSESQKSVGPHGLIARLRANCGAVKHYAHFAHGAEPGRYTSEPIPAANSFINRWLSSGNLIAEGCVVT